MLTRTLRAGTTAACLVAASALVPLPFLAPSFSTVAYAQQMPDRRIGAVDVNAITTAPLWASRSVEIDADPAEVFDYVSTNENWLGWFGDQVTGVEGDSSARTFSLGNGASLAETIVTFEEPSGDAGGVYGWKHPDGNPFGYTDHYAAVQVEPDREDGDGSIVTIRAYFEATDPDAILPTVNGGMAAIAEGIRSEFGGSLAQTVEGGTDRIVITTTRTVDAPRETVWRVVADEFGEVAEWASVISENTIEGAEGGLLGAERTCFIPGFGSTVSEKVTEYDEANGRFAYKVLQGAPPFATDTLSAWDVTDAGDGRTQIVSTITMDIADGTPAMPIGLTKDAFAQVISVTLDDLVPFVETGTPHPRELASR